MKFIRHIFVLLFTFSLLSQAFAADPVAIVIRARGNVLMKQAGKKAVKVKAGTRVYSGSKIITKKRSFAAIKFIDDGSLVRIRSNSSCKVEGKKQKSSLLKNLFLEVGTIFSKITRQKGLFRVTTPTSVASVKGTAFWTKQEFKGATHYFGEQGRVEIKNRAGLALLGPGETGIVSSQNSKPIVRKTRPGEKPQHADGKEKTDELEFQFLDDNGHTKELKFKIKTKK